MTLDQSFLEGKQAAAQGKTLDDNPYQIGTTKLGAPKYSEQGENWIRGFASIGRRASAKEAEDARRFTDLSQFKRKSNRHYGR